MTGKILRKVFVLMVMIAPMFTVTDCRKQDKCGCDGDVLFTLDAAQAYVIYSENGASAQFNLIDDPYSTFYFCNPEAMFPKLADAKSGDILLVSGQAFWNCTFLYQSSNYSYYSSYSKYYDVQVTDVIVDLYGKGTTVPKD